MLASTQPTKDAAEWSFEPKLDGRRALVYVDDAVNVRTRTGRNITEYVGSLQALAKSSRRMVLDGELVAEAGRAGAFCRLGPNRRASRRRGITFVAFDPGARSCDWLKLKTAHWTRGTLGCVVLGDVGAHDEAPSRWGHPGASRRPSLLPGALTSRSLPVLTAINRPPTRRRARAHACPQPSPACAPCQNGRQDVAGLSASGSRTGQRWISRPSYVITRMVGRPLAAEMITLGREAAGTERIC
jgi:hypothetical protein